ncbi:Malto-oligosyltrehalose trehalohydrolase [Corynebacterium occultum]|uniref:Malto-oligosyltrehalose trehalohydrolase n=2 Tax=Corynebacterium occultum TaxID=2675219 RepID=A0A6B8VUA4_9CORY|nr:Malto-oligosyltrehalose trehalohydrolase [Corynebacterium occultum]
MNRTEGGWWVAEISAETGQRYGFQVDAGEGFSITLPDPRSTSLPDGVHGLSRVDDPTFDWSDDQWRGRVLPGTVLYELHVGTFSARGDFEGVVDKLPHLKDLGVSAIELMPVQPFGGERNWGYDGVAWMAVQESYGGRAGLKKLVDAAHAAGIAVYLDVVYNHFGPDGNYNGFFGPYTSGGSTGWGEVVNISGPDSDEVRAFILDTVRQWFSEFHIDGLRLDAIHALDDNGAPSILAQMQQIADEITATTGVPRSLIAESDLNDPKVISSPEAGGHGLAAQWADDIHHGLHTLISGENHAYYADFGSLEALLKTLRGAYFFTGDYSSYRGRHHGRAVNRELIPAHRFVTYTTTHDQTGNRAGGDRPSMTLTPEQQVLKAAVIYCSPYTPMLFMGEEFGARTPFPFFVSHTDAELNRLTREGRTREFSRSGWDVSQVPDPADPATFESAKLDWDFDEQAQRIHGAYRTLLRLRTEWGLARPRLDQLQVQGGSEEEPWLLMGHEDVTLLANLSATPVEIPQGGELIYSFTSPEVHPDRTLLDAWGFALLRR